MSMMEVVVGGALATAGGGAATWLAHRFGTQAEQQRHKAERAAARADQQVDLIGKLMMELHEWVIMMTELQEVDSRRRPGATSVRPVNSWRSQAMRSTTARLLAFTYGLHSDDAVTSLNALLTYGSEIGTAEEKLDPDDDQGAEELMRCRLKQLADQYELTAEVLAGECRRLLGV